MAQIADKAERMVSAIRTRVAESSVGRIWEDKESITTRLI